VVTRARLTLLLLLASLTAVAAMRPFKPSTYTLLSPGAEPRGKLRYRTGAQAMEVRVETTVDSTVNTPDGSYRDAVSPLVIPVTAYPSPGGLEVELGQTELVGGAGASADGGMGLGVAELLSSLNGIRGQIPLDSRGAVLAVSLRPGPSDAVFRADPTKIEPRTAQALGLGRELLVRLITAMPTEEVGKGARWRVVRPVDRGVASYLETTEVELVAVDRSRLTLSLIFTGVAEPLGPYMGSSTITVSGRGRVVVELNRPLPLEYEEQLEVKIKVGKSSSRTTLGMKASARPSP
jgi:hypothetical protein